MPAPVDVVWQALNDLREELASIIRSEVLDNETKLRLVDRIISAGNWTHDNTTTPDWGMRQQELREKIRDLSPGRVTPGNAFSDEGAW